jgi:hypothetical protein
MKTLLPQLMEGKLADKYDLRDWLIEALAASGKKGTIIDVCKFIWNKYENELKASGNLFYTWQYDVRWAATELRKTGKMKPANISPQGVWELF